MSLSTASTTSPEKPTPARNLSQAFEALCVEEASSSAKTPTQDLKVALISPTGVTELDASTSIADKTDLLDLHPDLRRDLSQALVNRVSFYGIIHDINKEASAMAACDSLPTAVPEMEEHSPLVIAAIGGPKDAIHAHCDALETALIDEEEWLLSTIATREDLSRRVCPDTFLQAMGEKEYENPVASLAGNTRTQLWKPSRSWWEAKSGKNPWIEPNSHNKRWRYLWPLIHYHKFLAKCIKKLKRNGVDVKHSVSPVAVFLREEVCAVSDHLASLSLFDSDEWMECLTHFRGWQDPALEETYRNAVAKLKLRPLNEPGDVDSPLLRSQIDEHFLRSMATARAQLRETTTTERKKKPDGQPPVYPRGSPVPKHIHPQPTNDNRRQRWQVYPQQQSQQQQQQWWDPRLQQQHYQQQQLPGTAPYCDNSSVHSGLSADSFAQQPHMYPTQMPHHAPHYYPYSASSDTSHASGYNYSDGSMYDPNAAGQNGWVDPAMMYAMQMQHSTYYQQHQQAAPAAAPSTVDSPEMATSETPQKKPSDGTQSPFWSHLDQATLAMGLATPAKASPLTPRRRGDKKGDEKADFAVTAQPLLLQHNQYYGYNNPRYGAREGYGPPSPATQFMMSPQASFAYSYGYGFSPGRTHSRTTPRSNRKTPPSEEKSPDEPKEAASLTPPPAVRKVSPAAVSDRCSPSTVETTAESESLHEATA